MTCAHCRRPLVNMQYFCAPCFNALGGKERMKICNAHAKGKVPDSMIERGVRILKDKNFSRDPK